MSHVLSPLLIGGGDVQVDSAQPLLRDVLMRTEVELANNEGVPRSPIAQTRRNRGIADSIGSLSHPSVSWRRIWMDVRGESARSKSPHGTLSPRSARQLHGLAAPLNVMNYNLAQ